MKTILHLTVKGVLAAVLISYLLHPLNLFAQKADTIRINEPTAQKEIVKQTYPKVVGYLSFIIPLVTIANTTTYNFSGGITKVGFPVGVNVLYSEKFGFSYEFTPTITAGNGTSKVSNILFDPGTMFRFRHGFTIITRLAFETSGRYGFTPVFNQVYVRTKDINYFVALSAPVRFGNSAPSSIGLNLQFGFTFN